MIPFSTGLISGKSFQTGCSFYDKQLLIVMFLNLAVLDPLSITVGCWLLKFKYWMLLVGSLILENHGSLDHPNPGTRSEAGTLILWTRVYSCRNIFHRPMAMSLFKAQRWGHRRRRSYPRQCSWKSRSRHGGQRARARRSPLDIPSTPSPGCLQRTWATLFVSDWRRKETSLRGVTRRQSAGQLLPRARRGVTTSSIGGSDEPLHP